MLLRKLAFQSGGTIFFFSSRRRHTRCLSDWSSDVCSSDLDSGMVRYPRPTLPEALMHADIKVNNDTIRIFTTHLQSLQFKKSDYEKIDEIKDAQGELVSNSKTIFSKLRTGIRFRKIQSDIVKQVLEDSPYPFVFCG